MALTGFSISFLGKSLTNSFLHPFLRPISFGGFGFVARDRFVQTPAPVGIFLGQFQKMFGFLGIAFRQHFEPVFQIHVFLNRNFRCAGIQLERIGTLADAVRVEAVKKPLAR